MAPLVGALERILPDINGPLAPGGLPNPHDKDGATLHRFHRDVARPAEIGTDLSTIIEEIPHGLLSSGWVGQSSDAQRFVLLLDAEHNDTAKRVGHRAVGLPHAARHPAACGLKLPVQSFPMDERIQQFLLGYKCVFNACHILEL